MALAGSTLIVSHLELRRTLIQNSKFRKVIYDKAEVSTTLLITLLQICCGMVGWKFLSSLRDSNNLSIYLLFFFIIFFIKGRSFRFAALGNVAGIR
jgi:Flp pilus assembly protein protease CpaA